MGGAFLGCSTSDEGEPVADGATLRRELAIPHFRNPLKSELIEQWNRRDLVLERVRFQGRFGDWIPGLVVYSTLARTRPLPVIICMPGSPNIKEDLLAPMDLLPRWADRGFLVVSIDRPYHGDRVGDLQQAFREKGIVKVWGEYIYDLVRTIDYIQSRKEADPERIGILGLSMGGAEALLLGAIDERIDVVVSVAGHLAWKEIFSAEAWKVIFRGLGLRHRLVRLGAEADEAHRAFQEQYPSLGLVDATKVAPMLAGKPLLLVVGSEDPYMPTEASRSTFKAALVAYTELGMEDHLEFWEVPGVRHSFGYSMQERALAWFERWL